MQFPRFWHGGGRADGRQPGRTSPPAGEGGELGDEVSAFLAGRLVDHYAAAARAIPPWAALNRLAHAGRPELARLLTGRAPVAWAGPERLIAAHLLTRAPTPEALGALQRDALVPLELELIERCKPEHLGVDDVLAAAVDALGASPAA